MSIYCSGADYVVWHYEGSHVRPWNSSKTQVWWDIATIPPWIARGHDYDDWRRVCPYMRLSFSGADGFSAFVLHERHARRLAAELTAWADTPKVTIPRKRSATTPEEPDG